MKATITTFLTLLALTAGMAPAAAQDTIHSTALPVNVYDVNWPDSLLADSTHVFLGNLESANSSDARIGVIKYTDETLKVYGIAAALVKYNDLMAPDQRAENALFVQDTVNFFDEMLYLWQKDGDNIQQVGECLTVNVGQDPPQYYWDLGLILDNTGTPYPILPMFERYFQEPILVHDTFLVGKGYTNGLPAVNKPDGVHEYYQNWHVLVPTFIILNANRDSWLYSGTQIMFYYPEFKPPVGATPMHRGWEKITNSWYGGHVMLFPIITSNSDTTREGIENLTPVERNTVVSPNPATGTVRVASGFGLQHIEVYDDAGRRVYDAEASGMQAHIDVGSWPRGAYTVHVRTAVGTAIKKLLVQ